MTEIIVAIIAGVFGLAGVIITALISKSTQDKVKQSMDLTLYRIEQLEKKQDKHNTLIERMFKVEDRLNVADEKIKVANHRIDDLERKTEKNKAS